MKTKIVFHLVFAIALAAFATGCCTQKVLEASHEYNYEAFYDVSAVYGTTNQDQFALEGLYNPNSGPKPFHTFMIIPQNKSKEIHFPTNDNFALQKTIKNLPKDVTDNMLQTNSLPPFYYKITNLPTNNGYEIEFRLHERNSQTGAIVFLPFAFAADVALSPFYLLMIIGVKIFGIGHT